jgi:hypothetical protein
LLEVLDHPDGEHLPGIVRRVFIEDSAQQGTTARDRESDRECELAAERAMIHRRANVLVVLSREMAGTRRNYWRDMPRQTPG